MNLKKHLFFMGIALSFVTLSCEENEEKEDVVKAVSKKGSVETVVSVEHAGKVDLLVTKHKIWNHENLTREIVYKDTIPTLGDTLQTVKDHSGNDIQKQTKKEYEFYITVQ